jgi:EmrB/QacA subfamily drug resistance transporter
VSSSTGAGSAAGVALGTAAGRWVLLATVLGSGMAMLDATVVTIALPAIGADLGGGLQTLQWVMNGYTLTLAAFLLLGGSLGDVLGRRRVFVLGALGFAAASLVCALAPSAPLLAGARLLQGLAGALLTPGSLAIISASFSGDDRAAAVGAWSGFGGLAGAVGPFLGGYLIDALSWRWIFLLNLPLAAAVVAVSMRHVPESRDVDAPGGIDAAGATLGAGALAALTYGLIDAGANGATPVVISCLVVAALAGVGFVLVERRSVHPMLPLQLFQSPRFTGTNVVTLVVYAAVSATFFLLVLQLQLVSGFTPLTSGAALLPITALSLAGSARVGAAAARLGPRPFMTVGPVVAAAGLLLTLRIGPGAEWWSHVLPAVLVFGTGLTVTVAPLTAAVLMSAPTNRAGVASGVNNAVARTAGLLAVAVLPLAAGLDDDSYRNPLLFDRGFQRGMLFAALLLVCGGVLSALLVGGREPHEPRPEESRYCCPVDGPTLLPREVAAGAATGPATGRGPGPRGGRT